MTVLTKKENQFKVFMIISGITYFLTGFIFVLFPVTVLQSLNYVSRLLFPGFPESPVTIDSFWVSLSFSMMMTIAALCFFIQRNVRKNKSFVIPLLVSKVSSSVSSLLYFLIAGHYFTSLTIFITDGSIFIITLIFYLRASISYLELHDRQTKRKETRDRKIPDPGPATVISEMGEDKIKLLNNVLDKSEFVKILEKKLKESGKSKEEFSVVVKPNFMFMHSKKDISTFTDPELVESLIDHIAEKGFSNIALVESQSTLGNFYKNREVVKVAEYIGYSQNKNYRIVDLTEEMVPFDYGGILGRHYVGPTWRDADFRLSFAKNKTHTFCNYTLTLKNIYGTLPMQNKLKEYHTKREYDWPTIETIKHFPVHFGLIDAYYSADGPLGIFLDRDPNFTKTIIGGENLIAVDWVGAKKMGLDPDDPNVGRFLPLAVVAFGMPRINWVGDRSVYDPWVNVSDVFIRSLDVLEESYSFSNLWFSVLSATDKYFSLKIQALPVYFLRWLLKPIKRIFYRYDQL